MKHFTIPKIPSTESKSIRFPVDLIEQVENSISGTNCTFSAFVIEAVRFALDNMEVPGEDQDCPSDPGTASML